VRGLQPPDATLECAGEGPFLMAEELALQEGLRQGVTVYFDERPIMAWTCIVDRGSNELLAGPALPADEDGG